MFIYLIFIAFAPIIKSIKPQSKKKTRNKLNKEQALQFLSNRTRDDKITLGLSTGDLFQKVLFPFRKRGY